MHVNEDAPRGGNPNILPPEEMGRDAAAARAAGASVIHFHARNPDGSPAHDDESYTRTMRAIRAHAPEMIVHATLGQITVGGTAERLRPIRALAREPLLRPEFASVDLGSTNIDVFDAAARRFRTGDRTYVNATGTLLHFVDALRDMGVRPCLAAWAIPFLRQLGAMFDMGVVEAPAYLLLVHTEGGILGGHPATAAGLRGSSTTCRRRGRSNGRSAARKETCCRWRPPPSRPRGHVSIGIGDYPYPELGRPTTAALVTEVARMARAMGRAVATPTEARAMLGLSPR